VIDYVIQNYLFISFCFYSFANNWKYDFIHFLFWCYK